MAKLVMIIGPHAVGKMTVANALKKITGFCVATNHDSLEVPNKIFGWGTDSFKELRDIMRKSIFDLSIKNNVDLIFTFIPDFNDERDIKYMNDLKCLYEKSGGEFYFVELETSLEERIKRNVTEDRLREKPTKRNIERSQKEIVEAMSKYRMNSKSGEITYDNYLKINNENLLPDDVAEIIAKEFCFRRGV